MTVGFVLDRVRAGQQTAVRHFQETTNVLMNAPPLKKPPSKGLCPTAAAVVVAAVVVAAAASCSCPESSLLCVHFHAGPLKRLFTDKHVQSSPRFAPPPGIVKPGPLPQRGQQQQQAEQQQQGVQERRVLQPKHRALAARLAAATERQQRRQQYQQRQQEQQHCGSRHGSWSPQVATDIVVVCQELKLPQALAAALSDAAARGQVSCNPGILLSQVSNKKPLPPLT